MNHKGWMLIPGKTLHPVYILDHGAHHDFRPQNCPPYLSRCPTPSPAPLPYETYPPTPQIYENSMSGMSHQNRVSSQLVSPISGYLHSYSTPVSPYQTPPSTTWVDTNPQYIVQPPLAHVSIASAGTMADSCGIAELKETIEKVNSELNQVRTKISQLNAKVREQEECLSTAQTEMSNLREENAQAQTEISNLREENAQLASSLKEVSIGSAGTMADSCGIAELKETIEKVNAELIQSHTKISELNAKVREQEKCLSTAQTEMSNLREENAQAQTEMSHLREENAQAQTEMSNLREENAQAQTEMSNLREQNAQAQTEMSNLREENAQAQTEMINLREQNAQSQIEMINLREENAQAQTEMSNLREQNAESQTEMINLREQNAQAQAELINLREQNAQAQTEMSNLREENAQAQTEMSNLREQNAQAQTEMINLREQNAQAQTEMINLREQNAQAQAEMINLREENVQLASRLKESEDKCRAVQDRLELAEQKLVQLSQEPNATAEECLAQSEEKCWVVQERLDLAEKKLAQFSEKPVTAAAECLAQISFPLVEIDGNSGGVKYDSNIKHLLKRKKPDEETKENNVKTIKLNSILNGGSKTEKKLKLSRKKEKSCPSNTHLICNKEVVIQLERLNDSTVEEMTACGSALPPQQTKKKLKSSKKKEKSSSNPHLICNKENMIPFERLNDSTVAEMTARGSALPPEQTKKKLKSSKKKEKSSSNPHLICNKEDMIPFERFNDSTVAEMTACGSALPPEQTKKKLKSSKKKEKSSSNPHLICNKEDMIPFERFNDSTVAEMTACGSALPPEQTKKKLKLSKKKEKSYPSNPHLICNKEDVIPFETLNDSTVAEMTACGSALPPEQVNEANDDALGINSLPDEIIEEIFGYFTQNQLGQIARVCRRWNVLAKSPDFWRKVNVKVFLYFKEKNSVVTSFISGLPSCVTFLRLDFPGYDFLEFEELCVGIHQNCPHVEELIMVNLKISYLLTEVINFCTQLLPCVKKLVFHNCRFYDCSRRVELNDNSKIEVLDLFRCSITHFNKKQFSKLLYLKELRLADTTVNDTWFEDDTSFFNRLHVLDVAWTYITHSTILAIQRHGHNLKELYLCRCNLGYRDLNFNNSMLPHLKTICLRGCSVKCEGVVSLIQSCPSLENVYVKQHLVRSFAAHPFVVANRCKSEIVKAIVLNHNHKVDYLHT